VGKTTPFLIEVKSIMEFNFIKSLREAVENNLPYADYVNREFYQMQPYQQLFFCDVVAPHYLNDPNRSQYGVYKDLEYMARAVLQDKDVSKILGIDYREIGAHLNSLPNIPRQENSITRQIKLEAEPMEQKIERMEKIIDDHVMFNGKRMGIQNRMFSQSGNCERDAMPTQGWKFHISAKDLADYERLLEVICPEFNRMGVMFKVVNPEMFQHQLESEQRGKAITVYPTPAFDLNRCSPKLKEVLFDQDGIAPIGDTQIQGRLYARYGKFRGERNVHSLIAQDGKTHEDPRGQFVAPSFVKETSVGEVLNFYSDCAQRYSQTGDFKTYLQEAMTMTRGDEQSHAFVTLKVTPENKAWIENAIEYCDMGGMSAIYKVGDRNYALIHGDYAEDVLRYLDEHGTQYVRPDWDKRYDVYAVHQSDINAMFDAIEQIDANKYHGPNTPEMVMITFEDGQYGVAVDTSLNREFQTMCQDLGLHVSLENVNILEQDLFAPKQEMDFQFTEQEYAGPIIE
jgi:hypothetical protein